MPRNRAGKGSFERWVSTPPRISYDRLARQNLNPNRTNKRTVRPFDTGDWADQELGAQKARNMEEKLKKRRGKRYEDDDDKGNNNM